MAKNENIGIRPINYIDKELDGMTITFKRNTTIIKNKNGKVIGKSRCCPEDKFDLIEGIMQAMRNKNQLHVGDIVTCFYDHTSFFDCTTLLGKYVTDKIAIAKYDYGTTELPYEAKYKIISIFASGRLAYIQRIGGDYLEDKCYIVSPAFLEKVYD